MIKIKTTEEPNVIEVEVDGEISEHDINDFDDYFQQKKKDNDHLNLLIDIKNFSYTLDGLKEEVKFDANHLNDFEKVAVVSDKKWIELGTKLGKALPKVEVKHFEHDEKEKAMYWLS